MSLFHRYLTLVTINLILPLCCLSFSPDNTQSMNYWSPWSTCSASCGTNTVRTRILQCSNPLNCPYPNQEFEKCAVKACPSWVNLALRKPATQSSTHSHEYNPVAGKAVDGNRNTDFNGKSCTHTAIGKQNAWWQVDLLDISWVYRVVVYNRMDSGSNQLNNFKVTVSQNKNDDGVLCGSGGKASKREVIQIVCPNILLGRYVKIQIPGTQVLHMCEVEVMGQVKLHNLALGKPATQSSTHPHSYNPVAGKAVDGIRNTDFNGKSCTHTAIGKQNAWWQVDLLDISWVYRVVIYNRMDGGSNQLNNFKVTVSQNKNDAGVLCGSGGNVSKRETIEIQCPSILLGRYVKIQIPGTQILHMCEVEVIGQKKPRL